MLRLLRAFIAIALWALALMLSVMGYNPLESALYVTIAFFVHPSTSAWLLRKARTFAGITAPSTAHMYPRSRPTLATNAGGRSADTGGPKQGATPGGFQGTLTDYTLPKGDVEEMAKSQARGLNNTIAAQAAVFVNHHFRQDIGWAGGRIDFALKADILVKTFPSELAAYMLLCFPEDVKGDVLGLFKKMDTNWDKGSVARAAELAACVLTLMNMGTANGFVASMMDGSKTLVREAAQRIRIEYQQRPRTETRLTTPPEMIMIAAGEFLMGTSPEQAEKLVALLGNWQRYLFDREMPQRKVYLDAYWIDKYPVTNANYKAFVDATGHPVPWRSPPLAVPYNWDRQTRAFPNGKADHPVVLIDWYDACAYAEWAGKRLPTEAEWEKAARGSDGRIWPWGNTWDSNRCNHGMGRSRGTSPVTAHETGSSPLGVMDMAGNVWEWCADGFDIEYPSNSPARNPQGKGSKKVIRGGCFFDESPELYRCAVRDGIEANVWEMYRGFRCVRSA